MLYAFPYFPQINNPNENIRLYMTAALVEQGSYEISPQRARWGWTNDAAKVGDQYFSVKAPGTSYLGLPAYAAYRAYAKFTGSEVDRSVAIYLCRLTACVIPMLIFLFFFHRFLGRFTRFPFVRDSVFFSTALGSLLYAYTLIYVSHTLSAVAAFSAFMLAFDASPRTRARTAFFMGLLAASVTLFEYPGFVVSFVLAIFGAYRLRLSKGLFWFCLGGFLPVLLMMHFQYESFGSPFTPGHLFVETDAFREAHEEGLYGANAFHWDAAFDLLFSPSVGLFTLTPLLLFAIPGALSVTFLRPGRLSELWKNPRGWFTAGIWPSLLSIGLIYLVICFMNNWRGGWTIGPRYLATVLPFAAFLSVFGLNQLALRLPRATAALTAGLTLSGLVLSGIPSVYYPHIPPSFFNPATELFPVLLSHDFAPHNVGQYFGLTGTASMWPLFAVGVGLCVLIGFGTRDSFPMRLVIAGSGLAVGFAVIFGALQVTKDPVTSTNDLALITRTWEPIGGDAAAVLETKLEDGELSPAEWDTLEELYRTEGREREAARTRRRRARAEQP